MAPNSADRTFSVAAFAALSGVTPRALRHYDRLGLLTPRRSSTGYRRYRERDLETLEEIIALKFIGVPLKEIAAIRRRAKGTFARVLSAQREALEARRRVLSTAIEAIAAAEQAAASSAGVDAGAIRRIIEVMHMEQNHARLIETYTATLKARAAHLSSLSEPQRAALRQEWSALVEDVKTSLGEDPGGPTAQRLLDRWSSLLQRLTGTPAKPAAVDAAVSSSPSATALRQELWARRAEWLPQDVASQTADLPAVDWVLADLRAQLMELGDRDVIDFISRARAARKPIT